MAEIQVVRVERRQQLGGSLLAHVEGRSRPKEARERPSLEPSITLVDNVAAARKAIEIAVAIKSRGRKGVRCVEFVFAGPPPYDSPGAWSKDRVYEWAVASVAWVRECAGPKAVIAAAYLHTDERSPHVHVLLVPVSETGRLSWKSVERGFAADPKARGKYIMRSLQDRYHSDVGRRFGLARGEVGSKARHQPINRRKGLVERVLEAPSQWSDRQRAEAATLDAADARKERDAAVQRRRDAEAERDAAVEAQERTDAERAQALEAHSQILARAEAAEVERDEMKSSRSELLRKREAARKSKHEAEQALVREREARRAELTDWQAALRIAQDRLVTVEHQRDVARAGIRVLQKRQPPTQTAVDEARVQACAAEEARVRAEQERDKANAGWDRAYRAYEAEQRARKNAVESRDQLVKKARSQAYAEGRASRESEVTAAVEHVDRLTAEQDALRTRLDTDVAEARQTGRAELDVEVERLTDTIAQLQADLTTMTEARDQQAGELQLVTEDRDALWEQLTSLPKQEPLVRPRSDANRSAGPDQSQSHSR